MALINSCSGFDYYMETLLQDPQNGQFTRDQMLTAYTSLDSEARDQWETAANLRETAVASQTGAVTTVQAESVSADQLEQTVPIDLLKTDLNRLDLSCLDDIKVLNGTKVFQRLSKRYGGVVGKFDVSASNAAWSQLSTEEKTSFSMLAKQLNKSRKSGAPTLQTTTLVQSPATIPGKTGRRTGPIIFRQELAAAGRPLSLIQSNQAWKELEPEVRERYSTEARRLNAEDRKGTVATQAIGGVCVMPGVAPAVKKLSSWHLFIKMSSLLKQGGQLAELAKLWGRLDKTEKTAFGALPSEDERRHFLQEHFPETYQHQTA